MYNDDGAGESQEFVLLTPDERTRLGSKYTIIISDYEIYDTKTSGAVSSHIGGVFGILLCLPSYPGYGRIDGNKIATTGDIRSRTIMWWSATPKNKDTSGNAVGSCLSFTTEGGKQVALHTNTSLGVAATGIVGALNNYAACFPCPVLNTDDNLVMKIKYYNNETIPNDYAQRLEFYLSIRFVPVY